MVDIDVLLKVCVERGASDLHISAGIPPRHRINGNLINMEFDILTPADTERLAMSVSSDRVRAMIAETGEADFSYAIPNLGRFRVNIFKQRGSFAMVMRLISTEIPAPEKLGIPDAVMDLATKKRGMVLVTGPTGSGKSTTLASIINKVNLTRDAHIITMEDPIEYLHMHRKSIVNQREVGIDTLSYANALKASLREDPDVILVGEMRDLETISTAITAAETGHLVFSTLHTIGAAPTIDRIIDVYPPHQQQQIRVQLATVIEAIISQQLIPTIDGKARVAAYEVMLATPAIKNLIREAKAHQIASIIQTNRRLGMQVMDDAIYDLYMAHKIDAEKALSFSQDQIAMEKKLF